MVTIKRILRYSTGTRAFGIVYEGSNGFIYIGLVLNFKKQEIHSKLHSCELNKAAVLSSLPLVSLEFHCTGLDIEIYLTALREETQKKNMKCLVQSTELLRRGLAAGSAETDTPAHNQTQVKSPKRSQSIRSTD